jgi:hypothetical protein
VNSVSWGRFGIRIEDDVSYSTILGSTGTHDSIDEFDSAGSEHFL